MREFGESLLRSAESSLRRLSLAPGAAWALAWFAAFCGGLILDPARGSLDTLAACVLTALFGGFTWVGALAFAGRRAPMWILPGLLGLGLARGVVFVAFGEGAAGAASLAFEPWTLAAAVFVLWRAELLSHEATSRGLLCGSLAVLVALDVADGLVPLGLLAWDTTSAWLAAGLVAAGAELWALRAWSARRELQLERAEDGRRRLEAEVARERRTHALLQRQEAWLFDFFETAPDLLVVMATDEHVIVRCNRRFSEALGYPRRDLVGRPITDLLASETSERVGDLLSRGRRRLYNVEMHLVRRDGGELVALANVAWRTDPEGGREARAVLHDVTRLATRPDDRPVRIQETLAEELGTGVFHADDRGRCAFVNASFCEITGIVPDDARRRSWLHSVHPDDRPWVQPLWEAAVRQRAVFRAEHRVRPVVGDTVHVVTECTPTSDPNLRGFAGSMTRLPATARPSASSGGRFPGPHA